MDHGRIIGLLCCGLVVVSGVGLEAVGPASGEGAAGARRVTAPARSVEAAVAPPEVMVAPEARGRSGALRVVLALPGEVVRMPLRWIQPRPGGVRYTWEPVLGTSGSGTEARLLGTDERFRAPARPGIYELRLSTAGGARRLSAVRLVVQVPFERKEGGRLNGYHIGRYPTEGSGRRDRYAPPEGFIEVTPENQDLQLSDHFRIREFLTHDQKNHWPKYVTVDPRLLDKLELVMADLNARGIRAERMVVMSGFRTPQYNRRGLGAGRARLSRHQFGDAADVWVDNDGDWYMDDLNGDGRRDTRDARIMLAAVERVESRHPELVGGAGIYRDNGVHGPFIHIDARGKRARW